MSAITRRKLSAAIEEGSQAVREMGRMEQESWSIETLVPNVLRPSTFLDGVHDFCNISPLGGG